MKIIYLDCGMGAAGDMLTAALLELIPDRDAFIAELNSLGIPGVSVFDEASEKCGIRGTRVRVMVNGQEESGMMHEHEHAHHHSHSHDDDHEHAHHHSHSHDDGHEHAHYHSHSHDDDHEHAHHHSHSHDDGHEHAHHHSHSHDDGHEHAHHHSHSHDDGHEHAHHHSHSHDDGHEHTHHHSSMHEIEHVINGLPLSEKIKTDIINVYSLIAEAESHAHGVPVSDIHFHEVGTMDAAADITAVCMLMDRLSPEKVVISPVNVGSGQVRCAHGILPVPAPAAAYILRDVPVYSGGIRSELCTPTGAALLKYFASEFGEMPVMSVTAIGYGMGEKDLPAANCVRAMLGEIEETEEAGDIVVELACNIDDMTAEAMGFAEERFFDEGALEVFTVPAQMKKSRPGILLTVICRENDKERMIRSIFTHTTTLGIRENLSRRYILSRSIERIPTEFGDVRKKVSSGYGVEREKYEYEDIARIARERDISLSDVLDRIREK